MKESKKIQQYKESVDIKYKVFNSLFMNLPYEKMKNIGMLLPILSAECTNGLEAGHSPVKIVNDFFEKHTDIITEEDKLDFFFIVIQYVERQVVLFDSIEDARLHSLSDNKEEYPLAQFLHQNSNHISKEAMYEKLANFGVRIVFTAHPTQFYPLPVLDIINDLRSDISNNDINEIDTTLQQLGMTSFLNEEKPTPFEEAKNIIYYLRNVYYKAIGDLYAHAKELVPDSENFNNYNLVKVGFWPGGDRDGNPFVTADTTMDVADELRMTLMKCYYHSVKALQKKLTFKQIIPILAKLRANLYTAMFSAEEHLSLGEILNPLYEIKDILKKRYNNLYNEHIQRLIDDVNIFKTHFATLDIRQDSSAHFKVMNAIFKQHNLSDMEVEEIESEELLEILLNTNISLDENNYDDPIVRDTIKNIKNLKTIQEKNGEDGCNRYIISNSEDKFAVLFVYTLFKWCGYNDNEINFDIVPLFETMKGMRDSSNTMKELYSLDFYRNHVKRRGDIQTIMLGFSDGTKDGGYLKANWSIHETKENLSNICKSEGVEAIFFDGRGGPPARGGGKTHKYYASQGIDIANNEIQLTIQGQTITSTYGTEEAFIYNVEQMITAGLEHDLEKHKGLNLTDKMRNLMEELGELSFEKYDALKQHDKFIPYLQEMSTLQYYSNANIGSRPGKRGNKAKLTLSDLRAISFVGSWSQLKQNVPGYYGIGTALKKLKDEGRMDEVKELFNTMPYFKALLLNSMMSLKKSYFPLTSYMKNDEEFSEFWHILYNEYQLSYDMLLEVSGYSKLMQEEPISKMSIEIREQIVLPLLVIQQYALQKISIGTDKEEIYKKVVTRSLYGNINASRNSA